MTPRGPREMSPVDKRRVSIEIGGVTDPRLVIKAQPPLVDEETGEVLPVVQRDDHRGLQHLDGKGEPRPPAGWEDANAFDRYGRFAGQRAELTDEMRAERAALRIHERLALVMREIGTLQHPRAQQRRETDAKGAGERDLAPQGEGHGALAHAEQHVIDRKMKMLRLLVEDLEDLLDEHRGYRHQSYALMPQEEKDALLTGPKFRDVSPAEIHALHPDLGSERIIRLVRSLKDQDQYGNPRVGQSAPRRDWTDAEDAQVLAQEGTDSELADLLGRTPGAIRARRSRLRDEAA